MSAAEEGKGRRRAPVQAGAAGARAGLLGGHGRFEVALFIYVTRCVEWVLLASFFYIEAADAGYVPTIAVGRTYVHQLMLPRRGDLVAEHWFLS